MLLPDNNGVARETRQPDADALGILNLKAAICIAFGFSRGGCGPAQPELIMAAWGGGVKVSFLVFPCFPRPSSGQAVARVEGFVMR